MKIRTLPVYSKLADEAEIPPELQARLPEGSFAQESGYAK